MSRRRFEKSAPVLHTGTDEKPTLEGLLDLWGLEYQSHRRTQMIHCPLHEDNTPSCSLNTDKQLFNCHSCGQAGDAWRLIELHEGIDFDRARAYAAAQSLPAGSTGGGGDGVRAGRYAARGPVPAGSGSRGGDRAYLPAWRRRGADART